MSFMQLKEGKELITARNKIEKDLKQQLKDKNLTSPIYEDRVNAYLYYWDMEQNLLRDINERGFYVEYDNGGGQKGTRKNDSALLLQKYTKQAMDILQFLSLKPPSEQVKNTGSEPHDPAL
ncbi:terminase [Listeria monocytogenes]|nr:terminase [Listeria monocytogenes]EAD2658526.1 terminase [Listeria monocytogenes]EAD5289761.1 terminase [Listeria monocytogenes]EAF1150146.1 terminase [Listeria monocytogenes]EDO1212535.1 terminase [Listeria monocytogenes]